MTTDDIKSVQILIKNNDGEIFIGTTKEKIIIGMIAAYVHFVQVDETLFRDADIKELLKEQKE